MTHKQSEELRRRADDDKIRLAAKDMAEQVAREKAEAFKHRVASQRAYGEELRKVMSEREISKSPQARLKAAAPVGFLIPTKSSDEDLEMAFQREMKRVMGIEAKRSNDSAAAGPLLGFGAATQAALEKEGSEAAAVEAAALAAKVAADPIGAIGPARASKARR